MASRSRYIVCLKQTLHKTKPAASVIQDEVQPVLFCSQSMPYCHTAHLFIIINKALLRPPWKRNRLPFPSGADFLRPFRISQQCTSYSYKVNFIAVQLLCQGLQFGILAIRSRHIHIKTNGPYSNYRLACQLFHPACKA